ncbi:metallophosphoesterase family protein [Paenibacillus sp. y28]|uniref:metallophosphoesterase family protein n=1 Tax=Paenibacillus sp. y28 TaxID=3129110 RepID=UPI00301A7A8A
MKWVLFLCTMIVGMLGVLFRLIMQAAEEKPGSSAVDPKPSEPVATNPNPAEPVNTAPLVSMFIISDSHVNPDLPDYNERLRMAFEDMSQFENVQAVILTGDVTDYGRDRDYKLFRTMTDAYKLPPFYANMGNHDYYDIWLDKAGQFSTATMPNGKTDKMSRDRFTSFFGLQKPYHEVWIGSVHVILLSQETYQQENPEVGEGAWYSDEQLAFLSKALESHKDGSPVLVMIHQPLPEQGKDGGTHRVIPAIKFREILKPYPNVFVFSGHQHRELSPQSYTKETFHHFNNASVTRVRSTRGSLSQGLFVQVYENQISIRGRDFSKKQWMDDVADWTVPFQKV